MAKRELKSDYKELTDWINDKKLRLSLVEIINYLRYPPKQCYEMFIKQFGNDIRTDEGLDEVIPIITDIYTDNYCLIEPRYEYELKGAVNAFNKRLFLRICDNMTTFSDDFLHRTVCLDPSPSMLTESQFRKYLPPDMKPEQFKRWEI